MSAELGRSVQQFTGRGGAGNFVMKKNAIQADAPTKQYSTKPVAGNFSGRGGAGNFKSVTQAADMPPVVPGSTRNSVLPSVYKGGRGGAGNIEAVQTNEKIKDDREVEELIRLHSELRESCILPQPPTERPILRID